MRPIPDKAEVALEYPDKYYLGTFERTARLDAHMDAIGISLTLERPGAVDDRKSIHFHIHYALFAETLRELAKTVSAIPRKELQHRADAAKALHLALCGTSGKKGGRDDRPSAAASYEAVIAVSLVSFIVACTSDLRHL